MSGLLSMPTAKGPHFRVSFKGNLEFSGGQRRFKKYHLTLAVLTVS